MNTKQKVLIAIFTVVVLIACVVLVVFVRQRQQAGQQPTTVEKQSSSQLSQTEALKALSAPVMPVSGTNTSDNSTATPVVDQKALDSLSAPQTKTTTTKSKTAEADTTPVVDQSGLDSLSAPATN